MFYWQLTVFLLLSVAIVCITSSNGDDDDDDEDKPKMCFYITGSSNGDAKCAAYCVNQRKKAGGACKNRRCICSNAPAKGDKENGKENSQSRQLIPPPIDATLCRLYCQNVDKYDTKYLKDICKCSK